jgi:lipid A disaccharide synthetase
MIQSDFTAEKIVREIERLLPDGPPRQSMIEELAQVHGLLSARPPSSGAASAGGAIARVAAVTLETMREDSV